METVTLLMQSKFRWGAGEQCPQMALAGALPRLEARVGLRLDLTADLASYGHPGAGDSPSDSRAVSHAGRHASGSTRMGTHAPSGTSRLFCTAVSDEPDVIRSSGRTSN